jgi:WD40 repeat protein
VRYIQTAAVPAKNSASSNSKIVYPAAAVGVVLNLDTNQQQHWLGHSDDVLSMAVSADGARIATGELGAKPRVCVWSPATMAAVLTLSGFHR